MNIVLIDDDATFRDILKRSLEKRGHRVVTSEGIHAIEMCATFGDEKPDAILLDLKMPETSGLELIPALRKRYPKVQMVMLTGYGSIATAMEAVRLGANDYLTKPAGTDRIEEALQGKKRPVEPESISAPSLGRVEWEHLQRVYIDCNQNISKAARVLGINRRSLQRKLAKYPPVK